MLYLPCCQSRHVLPPLRWSVPPPGAPLNTERRTKDLSQAKRDGNKQNGSRQTDTWKTETNPLKDTLTRQGHAGGGGGGGGGGGEGQVNTTSQSHRGLKEEGKREK